MKVKLKGSLWTVQNARDQLSTYLNISGFGKGETKKFKEATDEADGWPDEHSFETFEHPSYANMDDVNNIKESLLKHDGFDLKILKHLLQRGPRGTSGTRARPSGKKRKLVPYEEFRAKNIAER